MAGVLRLCRMEKSGIKTDLSKADAPEKIKAYIQTEFGYKLGYANKIDAAKARKCDCWGASDLFCDMASTLG